MSKNSRGAGEFVAQTLLKGVRPNLHRGCDARALDQRQSSLDDAGEYRRTIRVVRSEVWLNANHPQRSQPGILEDRPQAGS